MNVEDIKKGMAVNYHSVIGGPATLKNKRVTSEPWQLGSTGEWVVIIDGVGGCVSLEALTKSNWQPWGRGNGNREIKFKHIYRCMKCGQILTRIRTLERIESVSEGMGFHDCADGDRGVYEILDRVQFTGLEDTHGTPIYEGDIVKDSTGSSLVVWNSGFASFCLRRMSWAYDHFFGEAVKPENTEIIGNRFESPELAKVA